MARILEVDDGPLRIQERLILLGLPKATTSRPHAKKEEELDSIVLELGRYIKSHEEVVDRPLDDDRTVTGLDEACVPELRSDLGMCSKGVPHQEVRGDIVAYIERRRDSSISRVPMGIGDHGGRHRPRLRVPRPGSSH